ncbi:MAG: PKD domain-containing protein [Bacteroidia bacterium]
MPNRKLENFSKYLFTMYSFPISKKLFSLAIFMLALGFSYAQLQTTTFGLSPMDDPIGKHLKNSPAQTLPPVYIDDSRAQGNVMYLDEDMYLPIKEWVLQGRKQTVPFDDFVEQTFGNKKAGNLLMDFYSGDTTHLQATPPNNSKSGPDTVCRCKFLVFKNDGPQRAILNVDPPEETIFNNTFSHIGYRIKRFYRIATGAGRAEYSLAASERIQDIRDFRHGPYYGDASVTMRFLYACTNQNKLPSDCACDKTVRIEGEYRGTLRADASGGGISNKDVKSKIEGGAIMLDFLDMGDSITSMSVQGADLRAAYATHSTSWSPELVTGAADLAKAALNGYISPGTDSTNLAAGIIDLLATVLTDDSAFVNESGGHKTNKVYFRTPNVALTLKPMSERVVILTSLVEHYHDINVGWFSNGQSATAFGSGYRMHAVLDFDNTNDDCCLERLGMWAQGGYHMNEAGSLGITNDPSSVTLNALRNNLVVNFAGPWDSFDETQLFGTTTDSTELCGCNVRAGLELTSMRCDSVVIDISKSIYPDDYIIEIVEIDGDGQEVPGTLLTNTVPLINLDDIINLTDINSPLGIAYNFEQSKFYRITLRVSGHCVDQHSYAVEFQAERTTESNFEITSSVCDMFVIEIGNTTGADQYRITVSEVDDDGVVTCCTQSTGWVNNLPNIVRLDNVTGPFGGYNFEGGKKYKVTLDVNGPCNFQSDPVTSEQIVEVSHRGKPMLTLTPTCTEVIFDAAASTAYTGYEIVITQLNDFWVPVPAIPGVTPYSVTGGMVNTTNTIGIIDLKDYYNFIQDTKYRVELILTDHCGGTPKATEDFTYTSTPIPALTGPYDACVDDDYQVSIAGYEAMEEFRMEVYETNAFGTTIIGPVIDFTNGWVNVANQNPVVDISPTSQITFLVNKHYMVKIFGRNSCSSEIVERFIIVEIHDPSFCVIQAAPQTVAKCVAEIGMLSGGGTTSSSKEIRLIDRSTTDGYITNSTWTMGDGSKAKVGPGLSYEYPSGGTYTVRLDITDSEGCTAFATKSVTVHAQSSFGSKRLSGFDEADFTVAPNPANDIVNVNYVLETEGEFVLLDLNGKTLLRQALTPEATTQGVSVENIPAGIYFGRVMHEGSMIVTHKILVKH